MVSFVSTDGEMSLDMNVVVVELLIAWLTSVTTDTSMWIINQGSWWRHQMETFSALLAICAGNSPVPGEFPAQRPVTRSFDVYFDLRPNKRLSKHLWGWWFETPSRPLWCHRNVEKPIIVTVTCYACLSHLRVCVCFLAASLLRWMLLKHECFQKTSWRINLQNYMYIDIIDQK